MVPRALLLVAFALATACTHKDPPPPPTADVVDAGVATPKLDAAHVLAAVTANGPVGVDVSVRTDGDAVGLTLHGSGGSDIALRQLASLPARVPGVTASALTFETDAWSATLSTAQGAAPALADVVTAAKLVFTGGGALLRTGSVEGKGTHVILTGPLVAGRTLADAGAAVAPGFTLLRVEAGASFVLEEAAPSPAQATGAAAARPSMR